MDFDLFYFFYFILILFSGTWQFFRDKLQIKSRQQSNIAIEFKFI